MNFTKPRCFQRYAVEFMDIKESHIEQATIYIPLSTDGKWFSARVSLLTDTYANHRDFNRPFIDLFNNGLSEDGRASKTVTRMSNCLRKSRKVRTVHGYLNENLILLSKDNILTAIDIMDKLKGGISISDIEQCIIGAFYSHVFCEGYIAYDGKLNMFKAEYKPYFPPYIIESISQIHLSTALRKRYLSKNKKELV